MNRPHEVADTRRLVHAGVGGRSLSPEESVYREVLPVRVLASLSLASLPTLAGEKR
jgi:hypothetical protein